MPFDFINRFKIKISDDVIFKVKKSQALEALIIAEKKEHEKFPKRIQQVPKKIHHNNDKLSNPQYLI